MAETARPQAFEFADIGPLNAATAKYVEQLPEPDLITRIRPLSVPALSTPEERQRAHNILHRSGIVVVPGLVSEAVCDRVRDEVLELCRRYLGRSEPILEDDLALYQRGSAKLKGYYQLSHYDKAVVTIREGQDQGMIDIFNCDYALGDALAPLRALFEDEQVMEVIGSTELKACNLNVYLNDGVPATRGFHVDSYSKHLKAFVYLTDVKCLADGPYTYVAGSHRDSAYRRSNQQLCGGLKPATEAPVVNPLAIVPVLAGRGALVLSDQAGIHRGWPQRSNRQRLAAVMKYA